MSIARVSLCLQVFSLLLLVCSLMLPLLRRRPGSGRVRIQLQRFATASARSTPPDRLEVELGNEKRTVALGARDVLLDASIEFEEEVDSMSGLVFRMMGGQIVRAVSLTSLIEIPAGVQHVHRIDRLHYVIMRLDWVKGAGNGTNCTSCSSSSIPSQA